MEGGAYESETTKVFHEFIEVHFYGSTENVGHLRLEDNGFIKVEVLSQDFSVDKVLQPLRNHFAVPPAMLGLGYIVVVFHESEGGGQLRTSCLELSRL